MQKILQCSATEMLAKMANSEISAYELMQFTHVQLFNLTGWPTVVVRCGTSKEGLPIGIQIAAKPWHDHIALAVAQYLEDVFGGWQMPNS